jgi:hypothetical protein
MRCKVPAIAPLELARQMTLIESEIFSLLKPSEFLHSAWNSKRKEVSGGLEGLSENVFAHPPKLRKALAANLTLLTSRFNQFASWVSSLILAEKNVKDRGHLIEYFIMVQRGAVLICFVFFVFINWLFVLHLELFTMRNYHGVMELHAALSSSSVSRLKQSWKAVAAVHLLTFARIDTLMSPSSNYREYRKVSLCLFRLFSSFSKACIQLLRSAENGPHLPFLGAWLTDLTFLGFEFCCFFCVSDFVDLL